MLMKSSLNLVRHRLHQAAFLWYAIRAAQSVQSDPSCHATAPCEAIPCGGFRPNHDCSKISVHSLCLSNNAWGFNKRSLEWERVEELSLET